MSRKRAVRIVNNLTKTINSMVEVKTIPNEQFPGARANKQKLIKIASKLIKKYKIENRELKECLIN